MRIAVFALCLSPALAFIVPVAPKAGLAVSRVPRFAAEGENPVQNLIDGAKDALSGAGDALKDNQEKAVSAAKDATQAPADQWPDNQADNRNQAKQGAAVATGEAPNDVREAAKEWSAQAQGAQNVIDKIQDDKF